MRSKFSVMTFASACLLLSIAPAGGRLVHVWAWGELYRKSDVVVIASATTSTDTKQEISDEGWGRRVGVLTQFKIALSLKGETNGPTIKMFHYRLASPGTFLNGPQLIEFKTTDGAKRDEKQYILFLVRLQDGTFEPTSGQFDPVYSAWELCKVGNGGAATTMPASTKPSD